ncbi:MAG: hypothetical protein Kow0069_00840 [Promethearchaeota archaeon]
MDAENVSEHETLDLEVDWELVNQVFDDPAKRHVLLFMFEVRSELLENLENEERILAFEKIMSLSREDEVYVSSFKTFVPDYDRFVDLLFELGLVKNVKSRREFEAKEDDFVVKLVDSIRVEEGLVLCSPEAILAMLSSNLAGWNRAKLNKVLKELLGIPCQNHPVVHPFLKVAGDGYYLPDDLYELLEELVNPYLCLRVELTLTGLKNRVASWQEQVDSWVQLMDPALKKAPVRKRLAKAKEEGIRDFVVDLAKNVPKLAKPKKFDPEDKSEEYLRWAKALNRLLCAWLEGTALLQEIEGIERKYSGKKREMTYLEFMRKVSFDEDSTLTNLREMLKECREKFVELRKSIKDITKKKVRLLTLDYDRQLVLAEEDD